MRQDLPEAPGGRRDCLLEKGRLAVIPDCGHLPQVECPDRFADTFGRFLDEMKPLTGSTDSPENTTRKEKR